MHYYCRWLLVCAGLSLIGEFSSVSAEESESLRWRSDDYPSSIPLFPVRLDEYSKEPVSRGKLSMHFNADVRYLFRYHDEPTSSPKRLSVNELRRVLQCAPNEPGLNAHSGAISMMRLARPSQYGAKIMAAWGELEKQSSYGSWDNWQNRFNLTESQEQERLFSRGYFVNDMVLRGGFKTFSMLRIRNSTLFHDWPWGRWRLEQWKQVGSAADPNDMLKDGPLCAEQGDGLIHGALNLVSDVPDSLFLMGGEQPFLQWNQPFPAFSFAARLETNEMPWPFAEVYNDEMNLNDFARNFTQGRFSDEAFFSLTRQWPWNKRHSKAVFMVTYRSLSHFVLDQAALRPDLIVAKARLVWDDVISPWNLDSTEVGFDNSSSATSRPGFLEFVRNHISAEGATYEPGHFKYNIVIGYSQSLTGRLAHILAHSGSVVLMPETPFRYHFSARLVPWVHYVPLTYSSADLIEKIEWLRDHDDFAQQIAKNAAAFGKSYLRIEDHVCYAVAALKAVGDLEAGSDILTDFPPVRRPQSQSRPRTHDAYLMPWWVPGVCIVALSVVYACSKMLRA